MPKESKSVLRTGLLVAELEGYNVLLQQVSPEDYKFMGWVHSSNPEPPLDSIEF